MAALKNPKHELFAQALATGMTADDAYEQAGYRANRGNASRLKANDSIMKRIEEIVTVAAEKAGVTVKRIVEEYARLAFSDLRKLIEWQGHLIEEKDSPEGGDVLVIRNIVTNHVRIRSSKEIDDDAAASIAEIRQGKDGLSIKLHSKSAALDSLAKHLGMFRDQPAVEQATHGVNRYTDEQRARALLNLIERTTRTAAAEKAAKKQARNEGATKH